VPEPIERAETAVRSRPAAATGSTVTPRTTGTTGTAGTAGTTGTTGTVGSDELAALARTASTCTRCALSEGRTQVVFGSGDPGADLLVVGEAPGREEDLSGEPFVGRSGKLLDRLLGEELGIDRSGCYIANVVKCRPPENRNPRRDEVARCRPYLDEQVRLIGPTVVVTLGNFATRLLLDTDRGIRSVRGRAYPFGSGWLVPTLHPAAALRSGAPVVAEMREDLQRARELLGWSH